MAGQLSVDSRRVSMSSMAHRRTKKFFGAPRHLSDSDLPTFSDIAGCYWKASETETTFKRRMTCVHKELMKVWEKCCPVVPLISSRGLLCKLGRFLTKVKYTSLTKKCSKQLLDDLNTMSQKLFDISACSCELPTAACSDPRVNCTSVTCSTVHILCLCQVKKQVPPEERQYIRDQRSKSGSALVKGAPGHSLRWPTSFR